MVVSNNIQQISSQSFVQYLVDLANYPSQQFDHDFLEQLNSAGIKSFLLQSTHSTKINNKSSVDEEILLLGISGRITKQVPLLISGCIHQQLAHLDEAHKHLAVVLDSDTVIEFAFYKFLADLIVTNQIQSLTVFSKTIDRSIELGIEFIQNFTAQSRIKYVANSSLPIMTLLDAHSIIPELSTF